MYPIMLWLLKFLPESSRVSTSKSHENTPEEHHSNLRANEMSEEKQKRIFLSPPHMGGEELRFMSEAFESNYIAPLGPMVDAFEKEFCERTGNRNAVAVCRGTAAMHQANAS